MKITICGLAGTGTSTLAKKLAEKLNYPHTSSGNIFRQMAKEKNLTLEQLELLSESDPKFDNQLDERIADYGKTHPDCVIDSRLAWYFVPDSLKVKLDCNYHDRINRVAVRDKISFEQAETETVIREKSITDRYLRYYNIKDFLSDSNFDLAIDTTQVSSDDAVSMILNYLDKTE